MSETGIAILTSLVTAHLIGDFILQTDKDVSVKTKPIVFGKHLFFITGLSYLVSGLWAEWRIPLIILITHGFIDWLKIIFFNNTDSDKKQLSIFLSDQFLHIVVIILLSFYVQSQVLITDFYWLNFFSDNFIIALVFISAVILLTKPGGIAIGYLVNPFLIQMKEISKAEEQRRLRGFVNGGRIIGYLERILILIFIFSGNFSAVGFLIAAKSVFRFGELTDPNNRMEAEYIIIGTLYSFIYSLIISYGIIYILNII
jgi:hypothetical protein